MAEYWKDNLVTLAHANKSADILLGVSRLPGFVGRV